MQFLILASLLVLAAGSRWPWNPRSVKNSGHRIISSTQRPHPTITSPQSDVNDIKYQLLDVERKMQNFCLKHTGSPLREVYGANYYRLYANFTGCHGNDLEVRAGQRLIAVQARDRRCDFIALRLLPDVVDSRSAYWRFKNGQLIIVFSYKSDNPRCGRVISDSIHRLPKFDNAAQDPEFEVRLGETDLENALRMYSSDVRLVQKNDTDTGHGTHKQSKGF